jgi:hypothetical protein
MNYPISEINAGIDIDPDDDDIAAALGDQIQKVRDLRVELESRTQELHVLQVAFNQQHANLIEAKCKAASDCSLAEAALRHLTLAAYHETGSKKPAQGVGIRITKSLRCDEDRIRDWAVQTGQVMFLRLDPGFEAWAKNMIKRKELPAALTEWVSEVEQAQPTIARDL